MLCNIELFPALLAPTRILTRAKLSVISSIFLKRLIVILSIISVVWFSVDEMVLGLGLDKSD
jgi:hypothetical protein